MTALYGVAKPCLANSFPRKLKKWLPLLMTTHLPPIATAGKLDFFIYVSILRAHINIFSFKALWAAGTV